MFDVQQEDCEIQEVGSAWCVVQDAASSEATIAVLVEDLKASEAEVGTARAQVAELQGELEEREVEAEHLEVGGLH